MQFIGMRYEEAAERWPSAAARDQHAVRTNKLA
jgi:hypothetical protein